jgi:hypothetical protein
MSINIFTCTCLIASASLLAGSNAWAQGAAATEKQNATPTTTSAASHEASAGTASGRREEQSPKSSRARVDQFGHTSGKQTVSTIPPTPTTDVNPANAKSMGSVHATQPAAAAKPETTANSK